jgi:hypothetical protein
MGQEVGLQYSHRKKPQQSDRMCREQWIDDGEEPYRRIMGTKAVTRDHQKGAEKIREGP